MRFRSPRSWGKGLSGRAEGARGPAPPATPPGPPPGPPLASPALGRAAVAALLEASSRPPRPAATLALDRSPRSPLAAHPAFRLVRGATAGPRTEAGFRKIEAHLGRTGPLPRVARLADAAVMGSGHLVLCGGAPVSESTYQLSGLPDRVAASLAEPPLDLTGDGTTWILAGNGPSDNYWHWIGQVLPAVLQAVDALRGRGVTCLGLVTVPLAGFQRALLGMLGLDALPRVELPRSRACLCGRLAYCDALAGKAVVLPTAHRRALRDALLAASAGAPARGERLYVSRADARRRPMTNEAEVEARLAREGFAVVAPGRLPVPEQVMAFHHARVVVGPHGAGLANVLFCRPEAAVLELMQASLCNAATASMARTSGATVHLDLFPDNRFWRAKGWAVDVGRLMTSLGRMA